MGPTQPGEAPLPRTLDSDEPSGFQKFMISGARTPGRGSRRAARCLTTAPNHKTVAFSLSVPKLKLDNFCVNPYECR